MSSPTVEQVQAVAEELWRYNLTTAPGKVANLSGLVERIQVMLTSNIDLRWDNDILHWGKLTVAWVQAVGEGLCLYEALTPEGDYRHRGNRYMSRAEAMIEVEAYVRTNLLPTPPAVTCWHCDKPATKNTDTKWPICDAHAYKPSSGSVDCVSSPNGLHQLKPDGTCFACGTQVVSRKSEPKPCRHSTCKNEALPALNACQRCVEWECSPPDRLAIARACPCTEATHEDARIDKFKADIEDLTWRNKNLGANLVTAERLAKESEAESQKWTRIATDLQKYITFLEEKERLAEIASRKEQLALAYEKLRDTNGETKKPLTEVDVLKIVRAEAADAIKETFKFIADRLATHDTHVRDVLLAAVERLGTVPAELAKEPV